MIYLILGILGYRKINNGRLMFWETFLMGIFIVEMLMIAIYEFFMHHYIVVLFLMNLFSNVAVFLTFRYLVLSKTVAPD